MTAHPEAPTLDNCVVALKQNISFSAGKNDYVCVTDTCAVAIHAYLERLQAIERAKGAPEEPNSAPAIARLVRSAEQLRDADSRLQDLSGAHEVIAALAALNAEDKT